MQVRRDWAIKNAEFPQLVWMSKICTSCVNIKSIFNDVSVSSDENFTLVDMY